MVLGEVAAPELAPLLLNLLALVGFVVALGAAMLVSTVVGLIVRVLKATVGHVPGLGSVIDSAAESFGAWLQQGWAQAIAGLDNGVKHYIHALTLEVDWFIRELEAGASIMHLTAVLAVGQRELAAIARGLGGIADRVRALEHLGAKLLHRVHKLEQEVTGAAVGGLAALIAKALKPLTARVTALEKWSATQVAGIEDELGKVVEPDIAALKQRATALEDQAIRLYQDAAGVWHAVNVDALVAAVALALPGLGLQWARCGNVGGVGRALCGLGSDLISALLGDALTAFAVADICDFVAGAQLVAQEIQPAFYGLVDVAEALVGCHGADAPADLPLPPLLLPAHNAGLLLAG